MYSDKMSRRYYFCMFGTVIIFIFKIKKCRFSTVLLNLQLVLLLYIPIRKVSNWYYAQTVFMVLNFF